VLGRVGSAYLLGATLMGVGLLLGGRSLAGWVAAVGALICAFATFYWWSQS
jgi:hypothetical protein